MVKVFGCRSAYENRPSPNRRGCVKFYGDSGFLLNAKMAASGRRSCRGGCGERDFAPGGRWHRSLPLAMFSPSVKVLAKGARMAVAGTTGIAAWGEGFPCRVTTASRLLCERGARGWPQVCSTAVMPIRAPRCLGSAAIVIVVSEAARNSRS
jgi:hypothetical protein